MYRFNINIKWKVNSENTVGSDNFPIVCQINVNNSNTGCFSAKKVDLRMQIGIHLASIVKHIRI